jgi:hypothetical protein
MKKIVLQKQPQVKLEEVNLNEIESDSEQIIPFERKQIPQIAFNTKKLDGLDQKLQNIKICNYSSDFLDEINKVLNLYDDSELKYNDKLVLFVMNEVEKFILKPKSGKNKEKLVVESVKKYFNNDDDLVKLVIKLVFKELSQVKFLKRQGLKILRFFLKVRQNQR